MFDAPRERVFRALTEPDQLVKWWGPTGMHVIDHDMDVRVGGSWRTTIEAESGDQYTMSGVYHALEPPERLIFTWGWERDGVRGHETEVTIHLKDHGKGTELTLRQQIFEIEEACLSHGSGWSESLDCLEIALMSVAIR